MGAIQPKQGARYQPKQGALRRPKRGGVPVARPTGTPQTVIDTLNKELKRVDRAIPSRATTPR